MNCIDAVEGLAKAILERFVDVAAEYRMDVSEYICNVKAIVETVTGFVKNNPEISETPELIQDVLCAYAKARWLARFEKTSGDPDQTEGVGPDFEYQAYCYDYVYTHGNYPR